MMKCYGDDHAPCLQIIIIFLENLLFERLKGCRKISGMEGTGYLYVCLEEDWQLGFCRLT